MPVRDAIFIDSANQTVKHVTFKGSIHEVYPLLQCTHVDVFYFDPLHELIVQDTFRCSASKNFGFIFDGIPCIGSGLIVPQIKKDSSYFELGLTAESVSSLVRWISVSPKELEADSEQA